MMERHPENGKMRIDCDQEVDCGKGPEGFPDLRSGSQEACVFVRGMSVQTLGCAMGFRAQNSGDKSRSLVQLLAELVPSFFSTQHMGDQFRINSLCHFVSPCLSVPSHSEVLGAYHWE